MSRNARRLTDVAWWTSWPGAYPEGVGKGCFDHRCFRLKFELSLCWAEVASASLMLSEVSFLFCLLIPPVLLLEPVRAKCRWGNSCLCHADKRYTAMIRWYANERLHYFSRLQACIVWTVSVHCRGNLICSLCGRYMKLHLMLLTCVRGWKGSILWIQEDAERIGAILFYRESNKLNSAFKLLVHLFQRYALISKDDRPPCCHFWLDSFRQNLPFPNSTWSLCLASALFNCLKVAQFLGSYSGSMNMTAPKVLCIDTA